MEIARRKKLIISVLMTVLMVFTMIPGMAFADDVSRTLTSQDGFKIVSSEDADKLVTNVTIKMIDTNSNVMGTAVCADGKYFKMENIGVGVIDHFEFSASGYKDTTVDVSVLAGRNWYATEGAKASNAKVATITMEPDVSGIHTLSGTVSVTDGSTGKAISGASIELVDRNSGDVAYKQALAADGSFTISNIAPGSYGWRISADGYISSTLVTSGMGSLGNSTTPQTKNIGNQSVALVRETAGTAVISGKVTDKDGNAVGGVSVQLMNGTEKAGAAVTTAADGSYSIEKVEAGTYTLEATSTGYEKAVTDSFSVVDGVEIFDKNIIIEKEIKAVISGKVTDEEGNPIAGYVSVGLYQNGKNIAVGSAGENGEYTIGSKGWGYPAGDYEVRISSKGYISQSIQITVPKVETFTVPDVKLAVDPMKDAAISGNLYDAVTGEPISGVIEWTKDGVFGGSRSVSSGNYEVTGLRAGTYVLTATATNYNQARSVEIVLEDQTYEQFITGIDLYLIPKDGEMTGSVLSGIITADDNTAGVAVKAILMQDDMVIQTVECAADGSYRFLNVPAGTYKVAAEAEGYIGIVSDQVKVGADSSVGGNNMTIYKKIVLTGIEITKLPDKLIYEEGELLDTEGMEVIAYYSDGTSAVVEDYTVSGYGLVLGETAVTVYYRDQYGNEQQASFTVTVNAQQEPEDPEAPGDEDYTDPVYPAANDDGNITGTDENQQTDSEVSDVQTGDDINLMFYLTIMIICAAAAAVSVISRRRTADRD